MNSKKSISELLTEGFSIKEIKEVKKPAAEVKERQKFWHPRNEREIDQQ